jgi:hypothetical protein
MKRTGRSASRQSACEFVIVVDTPKGPKAWTSPRGRAGATNRRWTSWPDKAFIYPSWEAADRAIERHRAAGCELDFEDAKYCTFGEWIDALEAFQAKPAVVETPASESVPAAVVGVMDGVRRSYPNLPAKVLANTCRETATHLRENGYSVPAGAFEMAADAFQAEAEKAEEPKVYSSYLWFMRRVEEWSAAIQVEENGHARKYMEDQVAEYRVAIQVREEKLRRLGYQ